MPAKVEMHSTMITEGMGSAPLCEMCWKELKPEDRVIFYVMNYHKHYPQNTYYRCKEWEKGLELVQKAVLNEA